MMFVWPRYCELFDVNEKEKLTESADLNIHMMSIVESIVESWTVVEIEAKFDEKFNFQRSNHNCVESMLNDYLNYCWNRI